MHTCIHAYMHTCIRTYVHAYMHTCIRTYVRTYMHACIHAYMHTCILNPKVLQVVASFVAFFCLGGWDHQRNDRRMERSHLWCTPNFAWRDSCRHLWMSMARCWPCKPGPQENLKRILGSFFLFCFVEVLTRNCHHFSDVRGLAWTFPSAALGLGRPSFLLYLPLSLSGLSA